MPDKLPKPLFREEKSGGYKFDRVTGSAIFLKGDEFQTAIEGFEEGSFDFIERPENASEIALTAPLAVWHETTQSCNLSCKECGQTRSGEKELSIEQIGQMYSDLASEGVFEVRVTGGEACLRQDLGGIVNTASDLGLFVSLTSNGVYGSRTREKVANLPIGLYILSVDGTQEAHDSIRGEGTFASTMKTISVLADRGRNVRVNTVLMQQNKECIAELVAILHDAGVAALTLIPLRPAGRAAETFQEDKLTPVEYMRVVEKVVQLRVQYPSFSIATSYDIISTSAHSANVPSHWSKMCIAGVEAACLSPSGNLRACILHPGDEYAVGNLTKQPLRELWHNDALWGIFRDIDRKVLDQCRTCDDYTKKCPGSCLVMTEYARKLGMPLEEMYCFRRQVK